VGAGVVIAKKVNADNSPACVTGMRIPPLTAMLRSSAGDWALRSLVSALASCSASTTHGCIRSLPVAAFAVDIGFIGARVVKITNWLHALPRAGVVI